ncbi:MAG: ABC transporter permease [Actinobacteria bacterium HGW-Actinobacteria-5]|jgi:hypothetical protein|nr:MAG: ABC transporter permease [Actinobacteria bacterium HGW-Actinobacteria-5]
MSKKSRKLIRSTPVAGEAEAEVEVEAVVPAAPERTFFFLPDAPPLEVDEHELHGLMKLWRHGRATRSIGQVLQDSYVMLFSVVMIGAMVVSVVLRAQGNMAGCSTDACASGRLLVPTAMVLACFAVALGVARLFGPVLASAAEGFWLMDAPISRRRLLRGRLVLPLLLSFLVAGLGTALVGALSGLAWAQVLAWSCAAALGSAGLVSLAASEQTRERVVVVKVLQAVFAAAALAVLLVVVSVAAGWLPTTFVAVAEPATWLFAGVAAAGLIGMVVLLQLTVARLEEIRRARLVSGGSLVAGMQGAMFALDFGLIRDILVERRMAEKGHVKPTRGRGLGLAALVWRDVERLKRQPSAFLGLGMSLFVPYAVDALRMSQLNPFISGLALVAGLVPFLGSMRVLSRTGGLARTFPFKTAQLRTATMAVPAMLALVWGLAATPAFIGIASTGADRSIISGLSVALVTSLAGLMGAVRWVTAKKVDYQTPMMATSSGALPPGLIFNLFRGLDMVVLITAPLILQLPAYWSLVIGLIVFWALRGSFNMADLQAEQEQAKRELAEAKEGRGEKQKIPRPGR